MTLSRATIFQLFKYTVYVLLTMNVFWFFIEEHAAAALQFANGLDLSRIIEAYAATIDTAAWVVLLLMFELETYVLDAQQQNRIVTWSLHGLRVFCYAFIVYAFYGYIVNLTYLNSTTPLPGVSDLCALAGADWSFAVNLDEYVMINAQNCSTFSDALRFFQFDNMRAVVDAESLQAIRNLAWVDVINAGVWLIVVLVLEIDVRLQEHGRFEGWALRISNVSKFVLYSLLLIAAVYWGVNGDFVDFWDAFLWLVAFVFIELNVFEWHQEAREEAALDIPSAPI